jgi:uncharacterized protein YbjT (DUF2867 family)
MQTAIVVGATGATGQQLVQRLIEDAHFSKITIFTRSAFLVKHAKIEAHTVDFNLIDQWKHLIKGDVLFSTMGTTVKQAGSQVAQFKVDYTYQYNVAKAAAENNVHTYVLVSAAGARPQSLLFYFKIKCELEEAVKQLPFKSIHIFKPGLLDRAVRDRKAETIGIKVINAFNKIGLLKSMKALHVHDLAEKMCIVSKSKLLGIHIYNPKVILQIS